MKLEISGRKRNYLNVRLNGGFSKIPFWKVWRNAHVCLFVYRRILDDENIENIYWYIKEIETTFGTHNTHYSLNGRVLFALGNLITLVQTHEKGIDGGATINISARCKPNENGKKAKENYTVFFHCGNGSAEWFAWNGRNDIFYNP